MSGRSRSPRLAPARQRTTPKLGSIAHLISGSLLAIGPLTARLLAEHAGTTDALLAFAVWELLVAITATTRTSLRT